VKIALIRQRYNAYGGAERFIERAAAALDAEGSLSLSLIAREWAGGHGAAELVRCDPPYLGRTWRDWSFARAACEAIARGRYDLVQSHERIACCDIFRAGDGVHAQWLENRARVLGPFAQWAQRSSPWHRYTLAAERRLFSSPRLKAVICNSRMVVDEVRRHFGVAPDKLHVIYNGVDLAQFHPGLREEARASMRGRLGIAQDTMVFLFVGSGFERKGVPQLLEAFTRLDASKGARLLVVGQDRKSAGMQSRAQALGLGDRVLFPGPQRDIAAWYAAADCFVLPTLYDPFPNAVLEAMACGLPVITSTQCGAAELLESGRNGWVCDALDTVAMAGFMSGLDSAESMRMGAEARRLAERFPLESTARQLTDLYRSLLAS
jgi:UDP-glucose:(heptosyl)LPS alpha-1,3-glucosyltransferase